MTQQQIDSLRAALQFSPENVPLRQMLAEAHLDLAQYEEAEQEYKEALKFQQLDDLKFGLSKTYLHLKKFSAARFLLDELLEKKPVHAPYNALNAKICFATDRLKDAKEQYDLAVGQNKSFFDKDFEDQLNIKIKESGTALTNEDDFDLSDLLSDSDIEKPSIKFDAVGGMNDVKEEIALKVIHPLNNPEIYKAFGKPIGGGILLYGPPGCGKTLIARATAGEINANFVVVGVNDILDMWIGSSEKNLHQYFENARRNKPCVIFFDEIDALAASRNDMRNNAGRSVINQFLSELDGITHSNDGVLILGATNSPWYLDNAFRRPGRFDRIVFVAPPDYEARLAVFNIFLKNKPTELVDYQTLAKMTEEFSGADIKAVVDRAIEANIPESIRQGKVIPISMNTLKNAIRAVNPSTKEWFSTAKNYALYSNESGTYDEILKYLKLKK